MRISGSRQGCSKWVSRGIWDRYFFVGIIHARRDIEARVGILTGRICQKVAGIGGPEILLQPWSPDRLKTTLKLCNELIKSYASRRTVDYECIYFIDSNTTDLMSLFILS